MMFAPSAEALVPPTKLGVPIPDTDHAVSVSMPTWQDNVDYEKGDPRVHGVLRSGYPRFVFQPVVKKLFQVCLQIFGRPGEACIVFPSKRSARECRAFILHRLPLFLDDPSATAASHVKANGNGMHFSEEEDDKSDKSGIPSQFEDAVRIHTVFLERDIGLHASHFSSSPLESIFAVTFPSDPAAFAKIAKEYWQHAGEGVSSRLAEYALRKLEQNEQVSEKEELDSYVEEHYGRTLTAAEGTTDPKKVLRERIAAGLNVGADDVYLFPCGMSAIYHAFQTVRRTLSERASFESIQYGFPYIDSLKILEKFGAKGTLLAPAVTRDVVDADSLRLLRNHLEAVEGRVLSLFTEFPNNPLLESPDLRGIRELAQRYDFPVVVDETIGTWENIHILADTDILVSSLTKTFSGDSNVMGGSLVLNPQSPFYSRLKATLSHYYQDTFWYQDAACLERNSRDYQARVHRINANAERLAEAIRGHPKVKKVAYPKFVTRELYDSYRKPDGGYGGLLSIIFHKEEDARNFFDSLRVCKLISTSWGFFQYESMLRLRIGWQGPSLGTNFTLVCPYTLLAHFTELEWAASYRVDPNLVRVSVGIEDSGLLVGRFLDALNKLEC